jgi:transposase
MKRHEIQVRRKAGQSHAQIARDAKVSTRTSKRIVKEAEVTGDGNSTTRRRPGRPSRVGAHRAIVVDLLAKEPELPTLEVLHRVRQAGYSGGKSALYELVRELRPMRTMPMVRFEGLPGEFSQHDFGVVDVRYVNGGDERIQFFASRLKYSRWAAVQITADQRVESLVRALLGSFESFGGVPLMAVFDNPKTVVVGRKGNEIQWNETFAQVAIDFRFAPELCTPRRANQKGAVENLVGFVKNSFFKVRRFHDRQDLERQLVEWLREVNEIRPSRATGVPPKDLIAADRARLRPLAMAAADYALKVPVFVGPTARVSYESALYSMSPRTIGWSATLHLYTDRVRIVAGAQVAEHPRQPKGSESVHSEHRAEMLALVSGERAKRYFKREQILGLGADAETLLTEIVHRHPRSWYGEVEILFDLLETFGQDKLRDALRIAVEQRQFAALYVNSLLDREVV